MHSKILLFLFVFTNLFSQQFSLSGRIADSETGIALPNTSITIIELNLSTESDSQGIFQFSKIPSNIYTLRISHLGYSIFSKELNLRKDTSIICKLIPESILLEESVVKSNKPKLRETPIAFSEKDIDDLRKTLGAQDAPHVLSTTPSLYISSQGGGTGDLRLNMRGFSQTNIAIMVNGIPVNNPENGEVYWSNWSGISDVISSIQVQRGLSANPYSTTAVGGLVNFQTYGVGNRTEFVKLTTQIGSNNFKKMTLSFNKAIIPNKLFLTTLISKKVWDGYARQTWLDEYTYYLAIGGVFGNHSIEIQTFGSPQEHGQRLSAQSLKIWNVYGKTYNSDWGYLNGEPLNLRDNNFHKPTINLNHNWQISKNVLMSNLFYFSPGIGGGTIPPWGANFGRTSEGLIDFDSEWKANSTRIDSVFHPTLKYTQTALRNAVHKHQWYGILSTIKYDYGNTIFSFGIDGKIYKAQNYNTVGNLLGGDYTIWSNNVNQAWDKLLFEGDIVDFNADSFARNLGAFFQTEINSKNLSSYINLSSSYTAYNRIDYFNYLESDSHRETGWKSFLGVTIKSGLNYNISEQNNIYFNVGYFSKPPLSENVFDYSNNIYSNVKNEKVFNYELGYGYNSDRLEFKSNLYYTIWKDRSIRQMIQDVDSGEFFYSNILGANARHLGFEFESNYYLFNNFKLSGMLSISNNIWTNNVEAVIYPESNPNQQEKYSSYVKDLYVGGYPMLLLSISAEYNIQLSRNSKFYIIPIFRFSDNQYANYNSDLRIDPNGIGNNSWKLPSKNILDLNFGTYFIFKNSFIKSTSISFNIFNVLDNSNYIIDAYDGSDHTANSALVWYGRSRWWSMNVGLEF